MNFKSIAVEGPIGVGKTSLVDFLAERLEARKVLERTENPFLHDFYQDTPGAAFQCQLFFLLNRFRQQQELAQGNLFRQSLVCDYIFAKDRIFAYLNLNDSELMVYEKIYTVLEEQAAPPRPGDLPAGARRRPDGAHSQAQAGLREGDLGKIRLRAESGL